MNKWVSIAIGAVIAISVIPMIANVALDLTSADGILAGTPAGTLLDLSPLVFVAGILGFLLTATKVK